MQTQDNAADQPGQFMTMIDTFASLDDVMQLGPAAGLVPVPPPHLPLQPCEPPAFSASTQQEAKPSSRKRGNDKRGAGKLQVKDQISELEQQLQIKMNEALELEQRNQRLRLRSRILEQVIGSRDRQVHTLRQLRQATLATQAQIASQTNSATSPSPLPSPQSPSEPLQLAQLGSSQAGGALVNPFSSQPPPTVKVMAAMPDAPSGPLDPPNWTTLKMYANMSLEKHMEVYTELVEVLSAEMVKPGLGRTREMRSDAAMLLDLHAGWMRRVGEQRTWLSTELSRLLANKTQHHSTGVHQGRGTAYPLEETNILDALEKNLRAEHAILMLVGEVFAFQLLTMEQSARVLIHSWPHISDFVAIMQCAVEQHAQAQQQMLPLQARPMLQQRQ
ncbi:hypothetical protein DUNSADRAFT_13534 [Dunaliella salina]|uniref:BZIP domain-containing protein n=1 Tax=Dunaliella salina TaxID=3046 RepID=A0ABQ7G944_DUNSA|nr:hypothetical protein DUNSADRAFT_13534 [Dunaliella salina]|eukprot:KAF5831131.1 hypothetical protein DUNSADRAFT_13534 [Dunaliella salina]